MKTALLIATIMFAGGFWFLPGVPTKAVTLKEYKTSKAKRVGMQPVMPLRIVVDKSDYELHVYDAKGWYATYPVVFGNNPLADKKMEGDKCTPEGTYTISGKKLHSKWSRFLAINYPTKEDIENFEALKSKGEVPRYAKIGGGIGIHGTWPHEDFVVDRYKNWTDGCIALKREDVEELYNYVTVGTTITIKK